MGETEMLPLEGPFTYRSGWAGRYDPNEGRYLGLDDVFMPRDFDPNVIPNVTCLVFDDRGCEFCPYAYNVAGRIPAQPRTPSPVEHPYDRRS